MTATFIACIEALSPAPSTSMRMQRSCSPTILVVIARARASACARASCGLARTSSSVCLQVRAASTYWRVQRCSAARWRMSFLCRSACTRWRACAAASTTLLSSGGVNGTVSTASTSPRPESLAASPARAGKGPGSVVAGPASLPTGSLCCGLQRTLRRPSERIVASCAGVAIRKLLSGNGCDIQPMSRWTNMPTRSAWTSI